MALSPDGNTLYVALNGNNTLGVINTQTDKLTSRIPVGNAPRQVVLADNGMVAYVSNEGGRPANSGDFTNLSDGTPIVSNRSTGGAITGTVSVVNLSTGKETREIPVGLQPTALYQDGDALLVANSNDDSISVINENSNGRTDRADQSGARSPGRQLRERDQHAGSESRAGQHRARQRHRCLPVPRPVFADEVRGPAAHRLVPGPGAARPGDRHGRDRGHE